MTAFQSGWSHRGTVDEYGGISKIDSTETKLINFHFMNTQITLQVTCNIQE